MNDTREPLPQNAEAEAAILGAALIEPAAMAKAADLLKPSDFYRDVHGRIFDAMLAVRGRNVAVDLLTLEEELRIRGQLESCGGMVYLGNLMESCATAANAAHYAGLVKDKSLRRLGIAQAFEIIQALQNDPDGLNRIQASNGHYHFSEMLKSGVKVRQPATRLSDVADTDTRWLWFPWLPRAEMTVISGTPGTMKTFLLIDIAARVTTGRPMPLCETEGACGNVLHIDGENKPSTIRKRLIAAGGELNRFFILTDDDIADLGDPYETLKHYVLAHNITLITIDPLPSFVPDSIERAGKIALRQRLFKPIRRLMEETGVTIVYLCHNRKGGASGVADPTQLAAGYQEYTSVPRSAIITARHPKLEHTFLLHSTKVNDAATPQSIVYHGEEKDGSVEMAYDGVTDEYNAFNAAFYTAEKPEARTERTEVKAFIVDYLSDKAWHKAADMEKAVFGEFGGTSVRATYGRARSELADAGSIHHRKSSPKEPHYWCLAGTAEQTVTPVTPPVQQIPAVEDFLAALSSEPDPFEETANYEAGE